MEHIMVAHHVAFAIDAGYPKIYASSVLSLFGVLFALGSLASLISDRIGRELTVTIGTLIGISGIVVLILIQDTSSPWMLYYYAMSLGAGIGICSPTIPAAITDIFQGPKVGFVIGFIWFGLAIGGAIGPWLGGWLFELNGNYWLAFVVAIILYVVACAAVWLAAPRKVRRVSGQSKTFPASLQKSGGKGQRELP
jgi:MFS family permease